MSSTKTQPPEIAVAEPAKEGDGISQQIQGSIDAGKKTLPPPTPPPSGDDTDGKPTTTGLVSENKETEEVIQEAKITRVPPEEWRRIKRERKVDPHQSVLLVSSKADFKTDLRKKPTSTAKDKHATQKKPANPAVTKDSEHLDVPYRLAINSHYLLKAIGELTGAEITETRNVLARPFKYLVWYENEIRQFFHDLESAYEQAQEEVQAHLKHDSEKDGPKSDKGGIVPTTVADGGKSDKETTDAAREKADQARRERDEFGCILEFMDRDMADIFEVKRQISDKTLTSLAFEHLWLLFRPGHIAYPSNFELDEVDRCQAYQVLHVTGGRVCFDTSFKSAYNPSHRRDWDSESENEERSRDMIRSTDHEITSFIIDCYYIDYDGLRTGPRSKRIVIPRYRGTRNIHLLPLYPGFLHPENLKIQETLTTRGRRFAELMMPSHKKYDGSTIREARLMSRNYKNFVIEDAELHGEVMVDQLSGYEHFRKELYNFTMKLGGGIVFNPTQCDTREIFDPLPEKQDNNWVTDVFDDSKFEIDRRTEFLLSTDSLSIQTIGKQSVLDDCLLLFPPRMYGYSLFDHKWLALDINLLSEIPPRSLTKNFEDLVLPEGHGMLLRALIKEQVRPPKHAKHKSKDKDSKETGEDFSMDVVAGKGKGLIILLHGVPGVGKTSTAECVAAELKRPLLPITCGDIGTKAQEAEKTLTTFCTLAHKWGCVLLLDEADVFLAKREKGDIKRNSLVSVFLRVLEYYSGVIILTTNRVGEFDEAFRSRIHISLYYPKLNQSSTREIWEKNLSRLKASGLDIAIEEDKILRFVDRHWEMNKNSPSRRWNGRQIKNAFQTAIALAKWDFYDRGHGGSTSTEPRLLKRPLLRAAHFNRVAQTSAHFDDYIREVQGFQEEDDSWGILAGRDELRRDDNPGLFSSSRTELQQQQDGGGGGRWSSGRRVPGPGPVRRGNSWNINPGPPSRQPQRQGGYDYDDGVDDGDGFGGEENDDEDEDVQRLRLELQLAKLKKKKGTKAGPGTTSTSTGVGAGAADDDDEETW